jgi:hypothetical protein
VKNLKRKVDMMETILTEAMDKIKQLTNEVERLKVKEIRD